MINNWKHLAHDRFRWKKLVRMALACPDCNLEKKNITNNCKEYRYEYVREA